MNCPPILAVIPARYQSSRFPGKPLVEISGKPMLQHVWERVSSITSIKKVVIATDDTRIAEVAQSFGATVVMTSALHPSGTDRVWEVACQHPEFDWILNVQGDEPFIPPGYLQLLTQKTEKSLEADILTLVTPIHTLEEWHNPNCVKTVLSHNGQALYFSRTPIPYNRNQPEELPQVSYRHLGVYLYRYAALAQVVSVPPTFLEETEKLEQLRALAIGLRIDALSVDTAPIGVDTPEDLERLTKNSSSLR